MLYTNDKPTNTPCTKRKRQRNIIWFNPPYSKSVKTNIAQNFLKLLDKHFPKTCRLHKIFKRNNVKVSYSCMPNVKSTISRHNNHILAKSATNSTSRNCNCRNSNECPLQGNCLATNIVYKAQITFSGDERTKEYIGMTAKPFKERYKNHKNSFKHERYERETELSKYVWKLKKNGKKYNIKWSILKRAPAVVPGGSRCSLCTEEKLCLLQANSENQLNKRTEIFAKCRHCDMFRAGNLKGLANDKIRTQAND